MYQLGEVFVGGDDEDVAPVFKQPCGGPYDVVGFITGGFQDGYIEGFEELEERLNLGEHLFRWSLPVGLVLAVKVVAEGFFPAVECGGEVVGTVGFKNSEESGEEAEEGSCRLAAPVLHACSLQGVVCPVEQRHAVNEEEGGFRTGGHRRRGFSCGVVWKKVELACVHAFTTP